jgi:cold shock CspA family protein/ribosome-associated translation inhibitor RaiA
MQRPLKIVSRDFPLSDAFEAEIREKASGLENFYSHLSGCEVTVCAPVIKHHRKGGPFSVHIRLTVPGKELAVDRQAEEELSQAIREAFAVAGRQLQDYAREQRGAVKTHAGPARGRVIRLDLKLGYGFLQASDGHKVYFHRNSVLNNRFADLRVGGAVSFVEEEGESGPQASTVTTA